MTFLAIKTEDGVKKGKISFYCRILKVTRQIFCKYLENKDRPWKYQDLADTMQVIVAEDEYNDTYGRIRIVSGTSFETAGGHPHTRRADSLPRHGGNRTQTSSKAQVKRDHKS